MPAPPLAKPTLPSVELVSAFSSFCLYVETAVSKADAAVSEVGASSISFYFCFSTTIGISHT